MVKLFAFIGVVIGLMDLAPTVSVSTMMAVDTADATADTGPAGSDTGAADTGELPGESDTGSASSDTGSGISDTGQPDTGGTGATNAAPKYSAAELAGEKGGCTTAASPATAPAAWLIAALVLVVTGRRR